MLFEYLFGFLITVVVSSLEDDKNGAAYLYQRSYPGISLSDRFEIVRNSDFVRNLTAARKMSRITKLEKLERWLRGYELEKFDLIDMYDKTLIIQKTVIDMMQFYSNRVEILRVEKDFRPFVDEHKVTKQEKLSFAMNTRFSESPEDKYKRIFYLYLDLKWEAKYMSKQFLPAYEAFLEYYVFPPHVQKIFNNTELTVEEKISTIDYRLFENEVVDHELTLLKYYFRWYLTVPSISTYLDSDNCTQSYNDY